MRIRGLVVTIARGFRGRGVERADLIQEGLIEAHRAATLYDRAHDIPYDRWAAFLIRRHLGRMVKRARRGPAYWTDQTERGADDLERVEARHVRVDPYRWAAVRAALAELEDRDRLILESWYGLDAEPMHFNQIGAAIGMTRGRAHQLKDEALRRLRAKVEAASVT